MTQAFCHEVIEALCRSAGSEDATAVMEDHYLRLADTDVGLQYVEESDCLQIQLAVGHIPAQSRRAVMRAMLEWNLGHRPCHFGLIDGDVALTIRNVPLSQFDPAADPMSTLLESLDDMAGHWDDFQSQCPALAQTEELNA